MKPRQRLQFTVFSRTAFFFAGLLLLSSAGAAIEKPDSAKLFSQLKSADDHTKLNALENIYKEFYSSFPIIAYPYAVQALAISGRLDDKESEVNAYYFLSYYSLVRGVIDSSFYFCQIGLDISESVHSTALLARGFGRLGDIYRTKGDKAKAIEYLKKAVITDPVNRDLVARCSMSLGILYGDAGCSEESVYYYLKALKIREDQNQLIDAGYLSCNLAGFYYESSSGTYGMAAYEKAVSLFRRANFLKGEGYAFNLMGLTYFDRKDYQNALKYFRKSMAINLLDTITVRSTYAFNLTNIGNVWQQLNRPDSARYYYTRSLKFLSGDQEYIPLSCTYLSLGQLNTTLKNYPQAIKFLNKGLSYSQLANFRAQWEDAYNLLSECYAASGDNAKALEYLKKRNAIRDSIVTEKAHQAVANMKIKYETEKKDAKILSLNAESDWQEKKIKMAVITILILISVAGVITYLTWLYYRKKLMPKVRTLNFIQEKISVEKEGDNRRLRALDKVLPPELKPFPDVVPVETKMNHDLLFQLEEIFTKEKIYLDEHLTLAQAAHSLKTNTTYLSRLINEHYNINFSAFTNKYRIEEAKKMILDDNFNNLSIEGIAKNSGFRSKSTFNQVFKQSTGFTPSDFAVKNGKIRA
ncbi:MAG: helix-turn-helix domain-containing protein [Bacteroidota bacterium]